MSKGIIVVDKIPLTCQHIRGNKEHGCPFGGMVCQITQNDVYHHVRDGSKPDRCPIKPLPEKKLLTGDINNTEKMGHELVRAGWNACINKLLKDSVK